MKEHNEMRTYQSIIIGIVIGFLAGVGTMQASLIGDVRDHTTRISHIEQDAKAQQLMFEERMDKLVRMLEALVSTNRELIAMWNARNGVKP
jgi:hypothetical protein